MKTNNAIMAVSMTVLVAVSGASHAATAKSGESLQQIGYPNQSMEHPAPAFSTYNSMAPKAIDADIHQYHGGPKAND